MDDLFQKLEQSIKALIARCEQLEHSNLNLTQNQSQLLRDKELLTARNKVAILQIENMVSRLKITEST